MFELGFAALATTLGATPREADVMWHTFRRNSPGLPPSIAIARCTNLLAEVRRTPLEDQEEAIRTADAVMKSHYARLKLEAATLAESEDRKRSKLSKYLWG